jgi:adenosylcobinamide-phosphate synthase
MSNIVIALIAYVLDRLFGEVVVKKNPTVYMNEFIVWFEESYYQNSVKRGAILLFLLLLLAVGVTYPVVEYFSFLSPTFEILMSGVIASMFISHRMLYETKQTTAEALSRFMVAPLLYLLLFGLYGVVIYKVVETLHGVVIKDDARYSHFKVTINSIYEALIYFPIRLAEVLVEYFKKGEHLSKNSIDATVVALLLFLLLLTVLLGI